MRALGVTFATVTAAAVVAAGSASAAATRTVPAGAAQVVTESPVTLAVPRDGRIDGYGYAGSVLGVATGPALGPYRAASGQDLWAFGLRWDRTNLSSDQVSAAIIANGIRTPLPLPGRTRRRGDSGPVYWVASEPSAAPAVTVEVDSGGFAQTFSLTAMRRVGPQPAALYRSPGHWETVVAVGQTVTLAAPDPADFLPHATLPITLHSFALTYFGPGGPTDTPPAGSNAWLTLNISSIDDNTATCAGTCFLYFFTALPADQVTLTLPGHRPETATVTPGAGTDIAGEGVFPSAYSFPVSLRLTRATLSVHPQHIPAGPAYSSAPSHRVTTGPATFHLSVPAPVPATAPAGAATRPAHYQAAITPTRPDTTTGNTRHQASGPTGTNPRAGGGFPAWPLAAIILAVAAGAAAVILMRRRPHPANPTGGTSAPAWPAAPPSTNGPHGPYAPPRTPSPPPPTSGSDAQPASTAPAPRPPPSTPDHRPPIPIPLAVNLEPPVPPDGAVEIGVLGPIQVTGVADPAPVRGGALEIAAFLALHPERAWPAERIAEEIGRGRRQPLKADTVRTYANSLRQTLGADRLPDATRTGYTLTAIGTDWARFQTLTDILADLERTDPARVAQALASALALVRGAIVSDPDGHPYPWVPTSTIPATIEPAVTTTAARLATIALDHHNPDLADWAVNKGLLVELTNETLLDLALQAGAAGGPDNLTRAWRDVLRRYASVDEPVPDTLAARYHELRHRA